MTANLLLDYARKNYRKMFREPDGALRYPFIVPGSVYSNCLWDWDSWLTNIALRQFVTEDTREYERGCILNFLSIMDEQGRIPIVVTPSFSKEAFAASGERNIHKPCLAQHAAFLVKNEAGDAEWLRPYFPKLCRFVDYYIHHCRHKTGLYFWFDDCAIGVDNDPATFYRPPKSSASIYLNCFMYKELEALVYLGEQLGAEVSAYRQEADSLKAAVREHCYDEKDGCYYSVDLNLCPIDPNNGLHAGAPRHWDCLIQRLGCWSGFLAMWSGIATEQQAQRMVKENLLDEKAYWAAFGVRTLSQYEKMYTIKKSGNPSCWLGPVWGISNYMVFRGLLRYGFEQEARELAQRTVRLFETDIRESGELHEYYHPDTGAPVMNPGFQNWNLLSLNMKAWLDGEPTVTEF
ncbi:MAG: glycoside hydrolase family 37 [Clostridia bacterium]|nr:glycoside hydrolase family 37 [Clostridia bacterium]